MAKTQPNKKDETLTEQTSSTRRGLLKTGLGAALIGAPFIRNAQAAKTTTWKVQTSWDAGTTGYKLFEEWAGSFKERSGGELAIKPVSYTHLTLPTT